MSIICTGFRIAEFTTTYIMTITLVLDFACHIVDCMAGNNGAYDDSRHGRQGHGNPLIIHQVLHEVFSGSVWECPLPVFTGIKGIVILGFLNFRLIIAIPNGTRAGIYGQEGGRRMETMAREIEPNLIEPLHIAVVLQNFKDETCCNTTVKVLAKIKSDLKHV